MPVLMILGPLRLAGPRGAVPLGGEKPRRILAALALQPGRPVSADQLTEAAWAGRPPRSARENLQTYVWQLRRAITRSGAPGIGIRAQAGGYLLDAHPGALDWQRFQSMARAGAQCLASDPAAAAWHLAAALRLWRGPVLAGLAEGLPMLSARIFALEDARLLAVERRIEADLALGRHAELTGELAELVSAHPLRERFRAQQMLALYRSGRRGEAFTAYRALRAILAEELGVSPGSDVAALYQEILNTDPRLDAPSPDPASHPARLERRSSSPIWP